MDERKVFAEIINRIDKADKQLLDGYSGAVKEFLVAAKSNYVSNAVNLEHGAAIKDYLHNTGKTPSSYFKEHRNLYKGWIDSNLLESFYYAVDNVIYWQHIDNAFRRTLRNREYEENIGKIASVIGAFHKDSVFGKDVMSLIKGNLSPEEKIYFNYSYKLPVIHGYLIAAEIDRGNKELEDYIEKQILEDGGNVTNEMIRGIMMSKSTRLYEALGKLLVAARLQEGTRQAICENMDCGREEAFIFFYKILIDNDMFRFSSVLRAGGTWTGILNADGAKIDRVSKKMFELGYKYLTDKEALRTALSSEDSMEIFMALWAEGCHDGKDSSEAACRIFAAGTPHQRLVAMYYLLEMQFKNNAVTEAVKLHTDETPLMALALPYLENQSAFCIRNALGNVYKYVSERDRFKFSVIKKGTVPKSVIIKDADDARLLYDRLYDLFNSMKSQRAEFNPIVFPWSSATLKKSDILVTMAYLSSYLKDAERIDRVLEHIADIESGPKASVLALLAAGPETETQRKAVLSIISGPDADARSIAFHILDEMDLTKEEYRILEDYLRLKKSDMRNMVLSILYDLKGRDLQDTIERLLSGKEEEKRLGGLSLIMMLKKDKERQAEYKNALKLLEDSKESEKERTDHEKTLISDILESSQSAYVSKNVPLFDPNATYKPEFDYAWIARCRDSFARLYPDSVIGRNTNPSGKSIFSGFKFLSKVFGTDNSSSDNRKLSMLATELDNLIDRNKDREYVSSVGDTRLLRDAQYLYAYGANGEKKVILEEVWEDYYEKVLENDYTLVLKLLTLTAPADATPGYENYFSGTLSELWGSLYSEKVILKYQKLVVLVLEYLEERHRDRQLFLEIGVGAYSWLINEYKGSLKYNYTYINRYSGKTEKGYKTIRSHVTLARFSVIYAENEELFGKLFPIKYVLSCKTDGADENVDFNLRRLTLSGAISLQDYIKACQAGIISREFLDRMLWNKDSIKNSVRIISDYAKNIREKGKAVSKRGYFYGGNDPERQLFYKDKEKFADRNEALANLVNSCFDRIAPVIAESELGRGDLAAEYSDCSSSLTRLYGTGFFVRILSALGTQKIDRSAYYSYYSHSTPSRISSLSHLLSVCLPDNGEDAEDLRAELKGKNIKDSRLVEAALFSPEWIGTVGEYLGWEGFTSCCYYFMAHMNEYFDDKRKAMIAKYTPFSIEELNGGAFDAEWFKDVYNIIGAERFKIIYDAAKYISDGAKHTRARKYADAVLGNLEIDSTIKEIEEKRNKDYLMCLGAIPSKTPSDIKDRYLFIRKFEKESRQYGAQRRASEKYASEMAIKNMAMAGGYSDEMRFVLRMESSISEGLLTFFEPRQVEDIEVNLELDESGKLVTAVRKDGKTLKAVPAKLKKNEYIEELQEAKKTLSTQSSRSKTMFEEAMEEETPFSMGELRVLGKSPVIGPVIGALVLKAGDEYGFLDELKSLDDDTEVIIAHPWHLYKSGVWRDFQKKIFDMELRQPFKQVFRELYVKTEEEKAQKHCNRFDGNQIQPKRTLALLKTRRWIADMEDGLQKVYYKKDIIASVYAVADWFSPADIEEPTLEWVVFTDRKSFEEIRIEDVPDILFSETMRDVDLVVSVAHAGGVDPEFSHSTLEMRKAIAEFTLPLFKLKNVTFTDSHALIKGTRANYSLHLGSGVIHQEGGPMINILPVHSQRRGKIFLPFVDEDPKTAEVISKMLLLAEDQKIKDPFILEQIK